MMAIEFGLRFWDEKLKPMEQEILRLLQLSPGTPFSAKEIGRRIDRDQYKLNAYWARPILEGLLHKRVISTDAGGYYVLPIAQRPPTPTPGRQTQ